MTTTKSAGTKFDRLVADARDLGLVVEIVVNSDDILESVSAMISRPQVPVENMLDRYHNSERIYLHAVRTGRGGRWSNSARYSNAGTDQTLRTMSLKYVPYALRSMTEA